MSATSKKNWERTFLREPGHGARLTEVGRAFLRDVREIFDNLDHAKMTAAAGQQTITPQMVRKFAKTARERMRIEGGGYRREHLRASRKRIFSKASREEKVADKI